MNVLLHLGGINIFNSLNINMQYGLYQD